MSLFDIFKKKKPEEAPFNPIMDQFQRAYQKKVPVILEDGVIEDEPYLSVMDDNHCIAVNHEYYHLRLNCPCLEWELENNNEYGHRKQFTMEEAKKMRMNTCRNCFEYVSELEKSLNSEDDE